MKINDFINEEFPPTDFHQWMEAVEQSLKGKKANLETLTFEEITIKPLYTKLDEGWKLLSDEVPGESTFIRGINREGYRKVPWVIAQTIHGKDFHELIQNFEKAFSGGQEAISFVFDQKMTIGEMYHLLDKYYSEKRPFFIITSHPCSNLYIMLKDWADRNQLDPTLYHGFIGFDPIGQFALKGKVLKNEKEYFEHLASSIFYAHSHFPSLRTIYIDNSIYENSGANIVQQMAIALSTGVEYVERLKQFGLAPELTFSKIIFNFSVGSSFFMEIAKFRALRALWSKIGEAYNVTEENRKMIIRAETTKTNKTVTDPYVNMLRSGAEAFAASLAQVQYIHVDPFDWYQESASELGERIARNTQHIIREETSIVHPIDPAGGSWYIEELTKTLMEKAWELFLDIENSGGLLSNLKSGRIQKEIRTLKEERIKQVAKRKVKLIGTNVFPNLKDKLQQPQSIQGLKSDEIFVEKSMEDRQQNINIHLIMETFLTIADTEDIEPVQPMRLANDFEQLRIQSLKFEQKYGKKPQIGLIGLGALKDHKTRVDFIQNFLAAGGIESVISQECYDEKDAVQFVKNSQLPIYIVCGSNEQYEKIGLSIIKAIQTECKVKLFLAGMPSDNLINQFRLHGLTDYIDIKTNCFEMNAQLLKELEVEGR